MFSLQATITPELAAHFHWDIFLYLTFLLGQLLFVLKRTAFAIRAKGNSIKTRRQYLYMNWDLLLIRMGLEFGIFYILRHPFYFTEVVSFFGWNIQRTVPQSAFLFFFAGFFSDAGLDWLGASPKAPQWLRENIPQLPMVIETTQTKTVERKETTTTTLDVKPKQENGETK